MYPITPDEIIELNVLAKLCGAKYEVIIYRDWLYQRKSSDTTKIVIYPMSEFAAYSDTKNAASIKKFNSINEIKEFLICQSQTKN